MRSTFSVIALLTLVAGCKSPSRRLDEPNPTLPPPAIAVPTPAPPPPPVIEIPPEKPKNRSITIPAGVTTGTLLKILRSAKGVSVATPAPSDKEVQELLNIKAVSLEGRFLPDTYRFADETADLELLRVAHERLNDELERAWAHRDPSLPLMNAQELLTLASIVEKETALTSESPVIAGVFITRLLKGMKLQSDPTVIYGMGIRFTGRVQREDLRRDTPYNTYTRAGLPPTPICLPSLDSIKAAANPKLTGAIFFVLSEKRDGSHYFSSTLKDHNAAVRRYVESARK